MHMIKSIKKEVVQTLKKFQSTKLISSKQLDEELRLLTFNQSQYKKHQVLSQNQLQPVYLNFTVQDILQVQYYYSYLIKKPLTENSQIIVLKYGNIQQNVNVQINEYECFMESRQTLVCTTGFNQSKWLKKTNYKQLPQYFQVKVPGQHQFRLGQKINALCVWNPFQKMFYFVRLATIVQIKQHQLDFEINALDEQINLLQARNILIDSLKTSNSQLESNMIVYSMISQQPMFLNLESKSLYLSEILPRLNYVNIKAPLKQSLFPYKNSQGVLVKTPMQMNMAKTFVVIDFSQFSNQKQVKIGPEQIDNLKALKIFVQQSKTIYRWQHGQSLVDHCHSGIIIKGSKIVHPHFYLQKQQMHKNQKSEENPFNGLTEQKKYNIRVYIQKSLNTKSFLYEQQRKKIEVSLKQEVEKNPQQQLLIQERMKIARLHAKSHLRSTICFEDYCYASELLGKK